VRKAYVWHARRLALPKGGFDAEDFYIAPWSQSSMPEIELSVKRGGEATDSVSVCP
jgi:hypothetical protein